MNRTQWSNIVDDLNHNTAIKTTKGTAMQIRRYQEADHDDVWTLHVLGLQHVGAYAGHGPWDDDLHLDTSTVQVVAQHLYRKNGYKETGETRIHRGFTDIFFEKKIR
jgi:hypothetical protein